jgi:hypothetical protein
MSWIDQSRVVGACSPSVGWAGRRLGLDGVELASLSMIPRDEESRIRNGSLHSRKRQNLTR